VEKLERNTELREVLQEILESPFAVPLAQTAKLQLKSNIVGTITKKWKYSAFHLEKILDF